MSKKLCHSFFIVVEAGAILISYETVPGHHAFVRIHIIDLIFKIYALFKHVAHI